MSFKMNSDIHGLLGLNKKHSTPDTPVFEKNLGQSWGYAEMDRTVTINKKLSNKQKDEAVKHEKLHVLQMRQGKTWYDTNNVYYKPKKNQPIEVYKRVGNGMIIKGKKVDFGDPKNNPIEKEVYNKTKYYPKKIK
tara:strand:- start:337 stop:741 length:405 start_codon:yes stop_codon:yes gene_type:complete